MSATLTWFNSGLFTKSSTGATTTLVFTDLNSMFTAKAGDSAFSWQVASANTSSNPFYIVLKPKAGGDGRILIAAWSSASTYNTAILDQAPQIDTVYMTYFPNGNTDTPAALSLNPATTSAPTILGNDTSVVKFSAGISCGNLYNTTTGTQQLWYMDSAEALVIGSQNPSGTVSPIYAIGAGYLLVDSSDTTYPASFTSPGVTNFGNMIGFAPWQASAITSGSSSILSGIKAHFNGSNKTYYQAFHASWPGQSSSLSVLENTATSQAWFVPVSLLGHTKGEGIVLKLRQIGLGPASTTQFATYSTGVGLQARHFSCYTGGNSSAPWFTNFKI